MITVHKHVYRPTTTTCCSIATNEDETPEEFEQTVMIGHAAPGTPHLYVQ